MAYLDGQNLTVPHTHSNYCHLLSDLQAITNLLYVVVTSFGYNRRYVYQSVRHYSVQDVATFLLIKELKCSVCVPGFLLWELDALLHQPFTQKIYIDIIVYVM